MLTIKNNFKTIVSAVIIISLFCFTNVEAQKAKTKGKAKPKPVPAAPKINIMMVKQNVTDYSKWLTTFQKQDSLRKIFGLNAISIGRGLDDTNTVIVVNRMDELKRAEAYASDSEVKENWKKFGITGESQFSYLNVFRRDTARVNRKERLMVTHRVKDFAGWLKVYDKQGKEKRMKNGLADVGIGRSLTDSNLVVLLFTVADLAKAKETVASEMKKKTMTDANVDTPPQIFFYKAEK